MAFFSKALICIIRVTKGSTTVNMSDCNFAKCVSSVLDTTRRKRKSVFELKRKQNIQICDYTDLLREHTTCDETCTCSRQYPQRRSRGVEVSGIINSISSFEP